jgi:anti-sigma-K factor RskA
MDDLHDLTAAYALDALDADEERAYEAHLAGCERCQEELGQLADTASSLAYAAAGPEAPAALRERILEQARAERTNIVPLRPRRQVPYRALTAIAACLVVGLGIWNVSLHDRLGDTRALAGVLGDPAAQRVALAGARGELVVADSGAALLTDLASAPDGKTYEAWLIAAGGKPVPAGTFERGGAFLLDGTPEAGMTVAVTVERDGGVDAPTTTPIVSAKLV